MAAISIKSASAAIGRAAKKFSARPLAFSSKVIGAAELASVLYDAHINGTERAAVKDRHDTADRVQDELNLYSTMDKNSPSIAAVKNSWFRMRGMRSWRRFYSRVSGYIHGAGGALIGNIPEIALSLTALMTKHTKILGKISGVLLAVNAAKTFIFDVSGFGKSKKS